MLLPSPRSRLAKSKVPRCPVVISSMKQTCSKPRLALRDKVIPSFSQIWLGSGSGSLCVPPYMQTSVHVSLWILPFIYFFLLLPVTSACNAGKRTGRQTCRAVHPLRSALCDLVTGSSTFMWLAGHVNVKRLSGGWLRAGNTSLSDYTGVSQRWDAQESG